MKQVSIVVPECGVNVNSVAGAYEILSRSEAYWQRLGNPPSLQVQIVGFVKQLKSHHDYMSIHPRDITCVGKSDLIIVPSLLDDFQEGEEKNRLLLDWIKEQYNRGAEIACICSGAFLLAATGLLDGKSCSIHWNKMDAFKQRFSEVVVAEDRIITVEDRIYTNGGAYSFLNLMLYLVERFFDRNTAVYCSKIFQIDIDRTTQSVFTIFHSQKGHGDKLIGKAQTYIEEHLSEKVSFERLASQLAISRRSFDRRFIKATGNNPLAYLQRVKVEAAKKDLEKGGNSVSEIMFKVGYTDDKAFREVFRKYTGLTPQEYRNRYSGKIVSV